MRKIEKDYCCQIWKIRLNVSKGVVRESAPLNRRTYYKLD